MSTATANPWYMSPACVRASTNSRAPLRACGVLALPPMRDQRAGLGSLRTDCGYRPTMSQYNNRAMPHARITSKPTVRAISAYSCRRYFSPPRNQAPGSKTELGLTTRTRPSKPAEIPLHATLTSPTREASQTRSPAGEAGNAPQVDRIAVRARRTVGRQRVKQLCRESMDTRYCCAPSPPLPPSSLGTEA